MLFLEILLSLLSFNNFYSGEVVLIYVSKTFFWFSAKEAQHADFLAGDYCLIGADVRQKQELKSKFETAAVDFKAPTLFICECVLVYMHAYQSAEFVKTLATWFDTAVFINYEQVRIFLM